MSARRGGRRPANSHVFLLTFAIMAGLVDASNPVWYQPIIKRLNTTLVQNAYYAKCLVDSPICSIECRGVAYGAGLRPEAARENARYYASVTGDHRCGYFVGQCTIRQYSK